MTKNSQKSSVYLSKVWLLARKYGLRYTIISVRVWKPINKLFLAEVDTTTSGQNPIFQLY